MYIALVLIVAAVAFLVYASASIQSNVYVKAFCKGDRNSKFISLTFDDGPHPINTPKVLEVLRQHGVKATFFCIGDRVAKYPDIVRKIAEEGHLVGNHTFEHSSSFPLFCKREMEADLKKANDTLSAVLGKPTLFFRPPFGVTNPKLGAVIRKMKLKTIGWSVRSFDTVKNFRREKVLARIESKLHNGCIILMHDDRDKSFWLVEEVIRLARNKGYEFKRVDELF